ncbi:2035_t:CDS:2 [Acaulospora colombiana]|uniref:2035_t:CDS:1 n=1 Tax=Acaulospora colombiana TaxID=27376 RepID=A0ACA9MGV0_9GLOM|nr:2035_t:CDS:2 [Acaulospora colombiana]
MQSSYFETFSHPEGLHWDNNWDALGAPPKDPTPFNNQGFWPSMRDPVQPYPGVPQLQTESLPSFSHTGLSSNGFSSSFYPLPALSNVPSGPPIQEAPPIPTAGGEISGSLHPVQHSREEYSRNPDLFINSMVPNPTDPTLRLVLRNDILPSEWWCENKKEPPNALDIFTDKLPVKPRQFECRFCGKKGAVALIGKALDLRGTYHANISLVQAVFLPRPISSRTAPSTRKTAVTGPYRGIWRTTLRWSLFKGPPQGYGMIPFHILAPDSQIPMLPQVSQGRLSMAGIANLWSTSNVSWWRSMAKVVPDPKNAYPFFRFKPDTLSKMREPVPDLTQTTYDYPDESAFSSLASSISSMRDFEPPVDPVISPSIDPVIRNHPVSSIRTSSGEDNIPVVSKKRKASEFDFGTTLNSNISTVPPVFGINYRINIPSRNVPQSNHIFVKQMLPSPEQEALRGKVRGQSVQMHLL